MSIRTPGVERLHDPVVQAAEDDLDRFFEWSEASIPGSNDWPQEKRQALMAEMQAYLLDAVRARLARPDRVLELPFTPLDVSSTEIRDRVANGEPIDGLVPPAVARLGAETRPYPS